MAAAGAHAADKPVIAPPGAWVLPTPLPAFDPKLGDAAVRILLADQQVRLSPGGDEVYVETATRIQTPQGLAAMGTISLPWKPETMTLTVHKLHVVRDGKVIDMLANGREFIVLRRENDLEHAVLDGMLTATIQPEGLQLGDIVDMAFTIRNLDPSLHGVSQGGLGGLPFVPIDHVRARASWASDLPVKWQAFGDLPPVRETRRDGTTEIAYTADNLQPPVLPKGAPLRYALTRSVQITGFRDWPAISTLFAPLYVKAATLGPESPLRAEVARIRAASPDPARRAELALALVQDQVRYVLLAIADGNLVPAGADQTWSRRFGDCKGKTALLLALLHALDIDAEPALVSARLGDGLDERLPMVGLFDHVIVRATIGGKVHWLDGTRTGDRRLADIDVPPFRWALPVRADKGATLERLEVQPPTRPFVATTIRIDASKGLAAPAPTHIERRWRGDGGTTMKLVVANLAADARERELKDFWRGEYAFLDPQKVDARFDEATGEETLTVDGIAKLEWNQNARSYEAEGSAIGYDADFTRSPGPNSDAPFAVGFPTYGMVHEEIVLPDGGKGFEVRAKDVDTVAAGIEYKRRGRIEKGVFVAETSTRSVAPEFAVKEAAKAQATIRGFKSEGLHVFAPAIHFVAAEPKTAEEFAQRGEAYMSQGNKPAAIANYRRALALDPRLPAALTGLGWALIAPESAAEAKAQFTAALAADPHYLWANHGLAVLAMAEGQPAEAFKQIDLAVAGGRRTWQALGLRGEALRALGRHAEAAEAYADGLKEQPDSRDLRLGRANALFAAGNMPGAAAEADALVAAAPDDSTALVFAAAIYARTGRKADADKAFERSLAIKPSAIAYLNRARLRPLADVAGRRADVDGALKLEPDNGDALRLLAEEQARTGDQRGALATLDKAIAALPKSNALRISRGIVRARLGDEAGARQDIAEVRGRPPVQPMLLNNLCWREATEGVLLTDALAHCEEALKIAPADAVILDSRGFVLLRLGRYAEAIRDYDAAIAGRPKQAASLYGRGIAKLRAGDKAGAAVDLAAARAIDANVDEEFKGYGITA